MTLEENLKSVTGASSIIRLKLWLKFLWASPTVSSNSLITNQHQTVSQLSARTTLCRGQRYFRFTKGCFTPPHSQFDSIKMQNGAMAYLKTAPIAHRLGTTAVTYENVLSMLSAKLEWQWLYIMWTSYTKLFTSHIAAVQSGFASSN